MPTVLIVDGDPVVRLTAVRVLASAGFVVLSARCYQHAIWYLNSIKADLALCDITRTPILQDMCSASPEMSVLEMIAKDGQPFRANIDALPKPFTASELLSTVRRCLARRRLTEPSIELFATTGCRG
jgi:DNA-binding NtrC family response regulator